MDRRELLGHLSVSAGMLGFFSPLSQPTKSISRDSYWDGERDLVLGAYQLQYDNFPNPVVEHDLGGEPTLTPKTTDDGIFATPQLPHTRLEIPVDRYQTKAQSIYRGSLAHLHTIFTETAQPDGGADFGTRLLPDSVDNELLALIEFTQHITYRQDTESTTTFDYVRYPCETLVDGVGDCQDKTVLIAALAADVGYEVGYAFFPGHVTPLVDTADIPTPLLPLPDATVSVGETEYLVVEATKPHELGYMLHPKDDLILTFTGELTPFNVGKITEHIEYGVEQLSDEYPLPTDWLPS